jgi:RNA polymerase sigma-70 factor (ECF subfamily)
VLDQQLWTDAAWISASVTDPSAFAAVFDRHWPAIHRWCVSRAGPAGEDLAAETFRIAFDERARFDPRYDDALGRVEARALGPALAAALREVPGIDRDALLLHAWADLTYTEIAHATGIPVGTVRSRIHRARTRLRAHLDRSPE